MSGDGAKIVPQDASNALHHWEQKSSSLHAQYQTKAQDVITALGDGSWIGDGDAAEAFRQNFNLTDVKSFLHPNAGFDPDATEQSPTGGAIVGGVKNLGVTARQAIELSLGSDEQQGAAMKTAHKAASNGAHDSGSSGAPSTASTAPGSRSTPVSTGTGPGSTGPGSTGQGSTGQHGQSGQDAAHGHSGTGTTGTGTTDTGSTGTGTTGSGTTGTGTTGGNNLPTTPPVGQDNSPQTPSYLLPGQRVQPIDMPLPGSKNRGSNNQGSDNQGSERVTSHQTTRDNVLPGQPLQPIDMPLPGSNNQGNHNQGSHNRGGHNQGSHHVTHKATSHEATRGDVRPTSPVGHVTSHETMRGDVLPTHQVDHPVSHETIRDNVQPTQHGDHPVSHVTSHESTRDNVLPGHDGGDNQSSIHTARTVHNVNDPQPIVDREVTPETEPPVVR